jgi:hypothetical protein
MSDSDKFPTDFVPVSRPLVDELGYQAAYIFGIVWNYCQMESGICNASHDTIANRAGMSRRSVIDYIEKLIEAGYIEDLTPDTRNAPHHLSTKKGVQILHTKEKAARESKQEEQPKEETPILPQEAEGYENPAHQNGVGVQNLPSGYAKNAHQGMQNLHKNRKSQETSLTDSSKGRGGEQKPKRVKPPPSPPPISIKAYQEITDRYPNKATWEMVIQAVGESPKAIDFWKKVIVTWIGCDFNPRNVTGMLDCFNRGELPTTKKNGVNQNGHSAFRQDKKSGGAGKPTGHDLKREAVFDPYTGETVAPDG